MIRRKLRGFTAIELMIVVGIIGILAAIAYPMFADQMRKARRADAMTGLASARLAQEKFRANCTQYARNPFVTSQANVVCNTATPASNRALHSTTSPKGHYNLAITAAAANTYTITATPTGAQAEDLITGSCAPPRCCGTFMVNELGPVTTTTSGYADAVCWKQQ